jgi:lipopolysaccharide exporter
LPTTELLAPLGRVMFPAFSAAKENPAELRRLVLLALSVQALIGIPAGVGIAMVAHDAIPLLLGDNWGSAVPFVQVLALAGLATALEHSSGYLLLSLGRVKTLSVFYWIRLLAFAVAIAALLPGFEAIGVAYAKLLTASVGLFGLLWLGWRALPGLGFPVLIRNVWRPVAAAMIMAVCVWRISVLLEFAALVPRLVAEIAGGAAIYAMVVFVLWRMSSSPEGAETYLLQKVPGLDRRLRGSSR